MGSTHDHKQLLLAKATWGCLFLLGNRPTTFLATAMQRAEILIYLQLHSGDQYILNANRSKTFSDNLYKLFPFHKKLVNVWFFVKTAFCNINVESYPNNLLPVRAKLPKHIMWKGSCLLLFQRSTGVQDLGLKNLIIKTDKLF